MNVHVSAARSQPEVAVVHHQRVLRAQFRPFRAIVSLWRCTSEKLLRQRIIVALFAKPSTALR